MTLHSPGGTDASPVGEVSAAGAGAPLGGKGRRRRRRSLGLAALERRRAATAGSPLLDFTRGTSSVRYSGVPRLFYRGTGLQVRLQIRERALARRLVGARRLHEVQTSGPGAGGVAASGRARARLVRKPAATRGVVPRAARSLTACHRDTWVASPGAMPRRLSQHLLRRPRQPRAARSAAATGELPQIPIVVCIAFVSRDRVRNPASSTGCDRDRLENCMK